MASSPKELIDIASFKQIARLKIEPIVGNFDAEHLRKIHAYFFQDAPKWDRSFIPGGYRLPDDRHAKNRKLAGMNKRTNKKYEPYKVIYSNASDIEGELNNILKRSGGVNAFRGLDVDQFAERMTALYVELDYLHPFNEGNSRALRFFTAQFAHEAGYRLDWDIGIENPDAENALYVARDQAIMNRKYPNGVGLPVTIRQALYRDHENTLSLKDII